MVLAFSAGSLVVSYSMHAGMGYSALHEHRHHQQLTNHQPPTTNHQRSNSNLRTPPEHAAPHCTALNDPTPLHSTGLTGLERTGLDWIGLDWVWFGCRKVRWPHRGFRRFPHRRHQLRCRRRPNVHVQGWVGGQVGARVGERSSRSGAEYWATDPDDRQL
jgi:hypothetical protein